MALEYSSVALATGNSNLDGTGTTYLLLDRTGALPGVMVDTIVVKAKQTTTAGMIRLFLKRGTSYVYVHGEAVTATTLSATEPGFFTYIRIPNFYVETETQLRVSTQNTENFDVYVSYRT